MTLRPKTGGIYANRVSTPNIASALGRGSQNDTRAVSDVALGVGSGGASAGADGSGWFSRPLEDVPAFDTRRESDNVPVKNNAGYFTVSNPNLPFDLYAPTLDGDEALGWYDYPSLIVPTVAGGIAAAARGGQSSRKAFVDKYGISPREALGKAIPLVTRNSMFGQKKRAIKKKPAQ